MVELTTSTYDVISKEQGGEFYIAWHFGLGILIDRQAGLNTALRPIISSSNLF